MKEGELYLSKYRILKVYKETLKGCVLLAEHIQLNSYWIIKKLNHVNDEAMREVQVLKGVHHPGIPLIVDVYIQEDALIIIREFVEGVPLSEMLEPMLSEEQIVSIAIKLCQILRFLHEELEQPLIYRDVKPANIIMMANGDLKLIDFGIARYYDEDKSQDTMYLGTKGFASPEQYGFNQSDVRTDVFGVGATLYFLATKSDLGKPPYRLLPLAKFRQDMDVPFEKLINKACEINKNQRFQTMEEMLTELTKLIIVDSSIDWKTTLNRLQTRILSISGLKAGIGTTHLCMRYASYLVQKDKTIWIVDASSNNQLGSLEYQDHVVMANGYLEFERIRIVNYRELEKSSNKRLTSLMEDADLIIIDQGIYNADDYTSFTDDFKDSQWMKQLIVSTISPWDIELFEEFVLDEKTKKNQWIIINNCSTEQFNSINESIEDIHFVKQNFLCVEDFARTDVFCYETLGEMEVFEVWPKAKHFLNPNIYKTKLFNRIKS